MQVLLDQHGALLAKLDQVTDSKLGDAIVAKAQEILNRINLTQNLLLVAATQELTDAVAAVKGADTQLTKDLQGIADTAKFIDSVTGFLGYVDKAIDIAKKVAAI
jgi:hypothetical protein